ncbi:MAG: penicillin-binding protein 2 [Gammaproteobacteria bacterium]|nr:penicillin-binding protein 2 [Gammaproteobacteria bacterium]
MNSTVTLKDHWKEQRLFLSRLIAAGIIILVLTGVLIWRLVQLQVVDHELFAELSQGNRLRIQPLAPTRGLIYDRNGIVLAENLPTWELTATPEQVLDLDSRLQSLEDLGLINLAASEHLIELVRSHRGFERVKLANLSETQAARFAVRRHHFSGIDIQEGLMRSYPLGDLTGHAVGYVSSISASDLERINRSDYAATSLIGKSGIERSYEVTLRGSVGYRQQIVNAQGRILLDPVAVDALPSSDSSQGALETRWPTPGKNIFLGLDVRLQLAAHRALEGRRGAAVAIEPQTGDILALVSMPTFDPNLFAVGLTQADFQKLNNDPDKPLFQRALTGHYPPGSTVKPFLGLAALHYDVIDPDSREMCPGHFILPGTSHRYRDWKPEGHGPIDLHQSIVQSCDTYFYQLAVKLGIDQIHGFLRGFGFGERTGIDVMNENAGVIPSREWKRTQFTQREDQTWYPGETVITGIGQGFTLVTPLQLAHATAALATSGQRFKPRLVIATEDAVTGKIANHEPVLLDIIGNVEEPHWERITQAMVGVTEEAQGSGHNAMRGTEYSVAGKTGTAQVFSLAADETYDAEEIDESLRDHGLFIAYAPVENPTIAIAVIVENSGGGGATAAPVARQILDAYFLEGPNGSKKY